MKLLYCTECNCLLTIDPVTTWPNQCHCRKSIAARDSMNGQIAVNGPCKIVILADKDFQLLTDGKTGTVKMQIIKEPNDKVRRNK